MNNLFFLIAFLKKIKKIVKSPKSRFCGWKCRGGLVSERCCCLVGEYEVLQLGLLFSDGVELN